MMLLDAYALVAFLVGGPAASQVKGLLREGDVGVATARTSGSTVAIRSSGPAEASRIASAMEIRRSARW